MWIPRSPLDFQAVVLTLLDISFKRPKGANHENIHSAKRLTRGRSSVFKERFSIIIRHYSNVYSLTAFEGTPQQRSNLL